MWPDLRRVIDAQISATYKGIDKDVRQFFFALDAFTLKRVFNAYEMAYGEGRRKYAERTYRHWQSGKVEMSGEISERLLAILPRFLSFDQKYQLVAKLWRGYRQPTRLRVEVSSHDGLERCVKALVQAVQDAERQQVPPTVLAVVPLADGLDRFPHLPRRDDNHGGLVRLARHGCCPAQGERLHKAANTFAMLLLPVAGDCRLGEYAKAHRASHPPLP